MDEPLERAVNSLAAGDLIVYPTETVYGLGADALDPVAIEQVFAAKGRDREKPLSMAVPDVERALEYTAPTERERRFMGTFLPGPVTVLLERRSVVPDALVGGRDRVGIRIPDHELALALLSRFAPITATSANRSGRGSVRRLDELDPALRSRVAVTLDGGETDGTESTVVDVEANRIVRRGALTEEIEIWLRENP